MITSILLFIIVSFITVPITIKYQKKYPDKSVNIFGIFLITILVIGIIVMILPSAISNNIITDDCITVHSYANIGKLYYDPCNNEYFIADCNNWNIFNMWSKIIIDYDLGQSIYTAENIIATSEETIFTIVKGK